jgi:[ribosomal protein S5]-alanine N-acetyltransferase
MRALRALSNVIRESRHTTLSVGQGTGYCSFMKITCPSCLLRPLVPGDAPSLARHANDHGVWQNLRDRFPHPYSERDADTFIAHLASQSVQTGFGIVVDGEAAGGISLMLGDDIARRTAEVGYWIGREYWGRGIMVEAVRAATQFAFAELDLTRVFALPFVTSARSARVLEKAGYVREGITRRSAVKEGVVLDQVIYAACDDSWR